MLDAIDRRHFLLQSAMTGTAFFLPRRHAWSAAPSEPVVDTTSGKICGMAVDGIVAFKGIPYGASTAGANRFMPPQKPAPWSGVRGGGRLGWARAAGFFGQRRPELSHLAPPPDKVPDSEDCLTLNLWTRGLDAGKRPVMVWFHGGAFSYGSANVPRTDGANLARARRCRRRDRQSSPQCFRVSRSRRPGWLEFAHSGNAGVLDLIAVARMGARQYRAILAAIPAM